MDPIELTIDVIDKFNSYDSIAARELFEGFCDTLLDWNISHYANVVNDEEVIIDLRNDDLSVHMMCDVIEIIREENPMLRIVDWLSYTIDLLWGSDRNFDFRSVIDGSVEKLNEPCYTISEYFELVRL